MKNIFIHILNFIIIISILISCKKGENDPFLSLHTRKARIVGEWKVSSITENYSNAAIFHEISSTYDGNLETRIETMYGNTTTVTEAYSIDWIFKKDGSFKKIKTAISNSSENNIFTTEGNWEFLGKNKNAKLKNKEAIILTNIKNTSSDGYFSDASNTFQPFETLIIDELRNNKIVFKYDEIETNGFSNYMNTIKRKGEITLTKK